MSLGSALRELGRFLDACRADGTVSSVELSESGDGDGSRVLTAAVVLSASLTGGEETATLSLGAATVEADGTLRVGFESTGPVLPTDEYDVAVRSTTATVTGDGSMTVEAVVAVPADEGETVTATSDRAGVIAGASGEETGDTDTEAESATDDDSSGSPTGRDRDVPPFRDRELLAEVYETHDTFAEMTEALGMDVTAETVRRYMVDHGIHQPNSYDTGGSDEEDSETEAESEPAESAEAADSDPSATDSTPTPAVVTDGIGLPDDVTVETLIETVKRSNTIYEVRQEIGIEHDDALEMLRELNLLDLVVGRLATEAERDISRDDIVDRLRAASATQ